MPPRRLAVLLLPLVILALPSPAFLSAEEPARRDAAEFRVRGGIPNVLRKSRAGAGVRVAYLGGSITAAPGWRVKSLADFQLRHPEANWSQIDAAIGGTGSDLGVFRVGQDALAHDPDLLFVEFAVNDGGADPAQIQRGMEGIVRQTWAANPETDIVFIYTLSEPFLAEMQAGKCSRAATAMEEVADHYGIPSIHFGVEVAKRVKAGKLVFKGEVPDKNSKPDPSAPPLFSTDGVHPLLDTGHILYAEALSRAWDELEKGSPETVAHALVAPLRPDHWADAKLVPITRGMLSGEWSQPDAATDDLAKRFTQRFPKMWRTETPGSTLIFRFRGSLVGFFDVVGPDGGQLRVKIDEGEEKIVPRVDGYSTYHRLSKFVVGGVGKTNAVQTLTVGLDEEAPDKATILFERNRPDLEKHPAKYAANRWNVGAILLLGEVADQ